ncbi:MAG TPA: arginine--tRNA ligase [Streptosporangiaceae bacterium]|nr:arginine--tRNA ligase [Streptosporangiaceae bacterium]
MADPQQVLSDRVHDAIVASFGPDYGDADPLIRPSSFADFQANVALPLGKRLRRPPREVAAELAARLDVADICAEPEVSGPGFINLTLRDDWIAAQASRMLGDRRLGLAPAEHPQTVVVEYSSPNVAKEMHVGHLRTTIVGDAIAGVLEFAGHRVIRDNHVGDWGTPFGMLVEHLLDVGENSAQAGLLTTDPNAFYQAARHKFDNDPVFTERARSRLVRLQAGDQDTLVIWQRLVGISRGYLHRVYTGLGVSLTDDDIRGESFYNDLLADTVAILVEKGIATVSDGALCAFPAGFTGREGKPLPLIIRKSDGGYNYATTDLAAVRYRVDKLSVDRSVYVVGSEQALHFQMVFAVAREAGWIPDGVSFEHAQIGMVLGQDGGRLRTREGETPKLSGLLEEGVDRARGILDEVDAASRFDPAELDAVAEAVGIGAVKYADLSTARESAYLFDWDRMISFRGNTGPYLQYATARIRSIFRRADAGAAGVAGAQEADLAGAAEAAARAAGVTVTAGPERALALRLLAFGAMVTQLGETTEPHRLCAYLFDVASLFTTFYEECPVLKAESESLRVSRLALCALTLDVLSSGLGLLGVPVPERM